MPQNWLPYIPIAALAISIFALFISGANLGWSVFKELGLRARVRVRFHVRDILQMGTSIPPKRKMVISVTNIGPGVVRIQKIHYKASSIWRRLFRRVKYGMIVPDFTEPLSVQLPAKLELGDTVDLLLPYAADAVPNEITHIGVYDSFGRDHWSPRSDVSEAKALMRKEFNAPAKSA